MVYKIAICDDNDEEIHYLSRLVGNWTRAKGIAAAVSAFPSAEAFLFDYETNKDYDILLLDIEMKAINGVELAKIVRRDNEAVQIIFVTGYSDYIADGYDVAALHYLMKPVNSDKLFQTLERAKQKLKKNEQALTLDRSGETVRISLYEIRYLEVCKNYVTVHAKSDYTVKKTLSEFEQELDERFFRIGRSYIVNLLFIGRITKTDVHLFDGTVIPLPRGQYEALNRAVISRI